MTVRVNKSSFNIREKLSELGRKFGLKGSELAAAETVQEAREIVSAGRRNLIINGACMINQRLGSSTYTLTSTEAYYPVDRFRSWASGGGQFTIQRSDNAPPGFKNSLMFTVSTADTSIASGDYYVVQQRIEGFNCAHLNWGTNNAKPVTLSFWVKADVTGKYGISFWPSGQNYNYVTHYTINTADTWEYKTITVPGATGGTWLTNNGIGLGIWWDFGVGTNYSTATTETWGQNGKFAPSDTVQMIKTNGAKFRMTGIQLEVGNNATEFEHRSYGEELALCQRYFHGWNATSSTLRAETGIKVYDSEGNSSVNQTTTIGTGSVVDADDARIEFSFPVTMRTKPTVTAGDLRLAVGSTLYNSTTTVQYDNSTTHHFSALIDNGGTMTPGQAAILIIKGNGYFYLNAEL